MVIKVKLRNSLSEAVRFRGVHFQPEYQFSVDVDPGMNVSLEDVPNGDIALTAYRVSDRQALDSLSYPVSDEFGFAVVLLMDEGAYRMVGEPFVISC